MDKFDKILNIAAAISMIGGICCVIIAIYILRGGVI